ncbi:MAG TPA: type IV conjugative transfer system protein TraE [Alphaproteobacteria bacterium]|nr:type IV conjugative transfer system protein TraE [Alphaproteobacteria bacterium]HQS93113.1 type IV conjugative transfer system protein TraE [Alphaproteobacteria bacterium]HQS93754.1 type IV conjugative transfer system protein TraE [Alphaproteobacteria bacterium]
MKFKLLNGRLDHILHQRNAMFALVAVLLMLNFLQALTTFFKSERIVVVPPQTTQEFWVEKNWVSRSYLEEMTLFFAVFILEMSPESASYKRDIILRNTVPESYGALKTKLLEDERRLKKEHVATSFLPNAIKVLADKMMVEITGDLSRFVGEKRISQSRDTYAFTFLYRQGRLLIKSFQLIRSDKDA